MRGHADRSRSDVFGCDGQAGFGPYELGRGAARRMGPILIFVGTVIAASVVASLTAVSALAETGMDTRLGQFRATVLGVAICFVAAFVLFALTDPDPLSWSETTTEYLRRTLGITIFAGFIWLPVFLGVFATLVRRRRA